MFELFSERIQPLLKVMLATAFLSALGCGIRGDPVPPDRPPEIGRGRPTFKRATEGIAPGKTIHKNSESEDVDEDEKSQ